MNIRRSDVGKYLCVAENGIGQAAISKLSTVDVQCKCYFQAEMQILAPC